ncbi:hypothetical protein [Streptomyces sp. Act143]|uniref:hypothetical protein n=1 Tax=Streptomyces sp. Act143 TaxID=2200760 RepID=UPI0015E7EF20|nr:hypothetical protein [Streptomyces sp. Act143]
MSRPLRRHAFPTSLAKVKLRLDLLEKGPGERDEQFAALLASVRRMLGGLSPAR